MKIFLTGHNGFIGKHLHKSLIESNYEVVTDFRFWSDKYDLIIHLAAVTHIRNEFDPKMIESNIILTNEVFKRPEKIIYASSCSARHFTNPYAMSKLWAEYLGQKHGNSIGLRFFNVYGPDNNKGLIWWLMQQKDGARITVRGDQIVRDYIGVFCVVDEIVRAIDYPPGVYDVGTTTGVESIDVVNMYMKISGKRFIINVDPPGDNEPIKMVSDRRTTNIELFEGLEQIIKSDE